jgi:hypothetical protein
MLNFYQMNLLIEEDRSIYTDPRVPASGVEVI